MSDPKQLVNKLLNYCDILRDGGLSCGGDVEQLALGLSRGRRKAQNKTCPMAGCLIYYT